MVDIILLLKLKTALHFIFSSFYLSCVNYDTILSYHLIFLSTVLSHFLCLLLFTVNKTIFKRAVSPLSPQITSNLYDKEEVWFYLLTFFFFCISLNHLINCFNRLLVFCFFFFGFYLNRLAEKIYSELL